MDHPITPAEQARANAIPLEVKKDGLQQRQSGDWMLRFVVSAIDMDVRLTQAPMGTRYQCVLVEINDDETPKHNAARQHWREMGPTKQASMRCQDPIFWAFLSEEMHFSEIQNEQRAAQCVREICNIASRSELSQPGQIEARQVWYDLDNHFQAWRARDG